MHVTGQFVLWRHPLRRLRKPRHVRYLHNSSHTPRSATYLRPGSRGPQRISAARAFVPLHLECHNEDPHWVGTRQSFHRLQFRRESYTSFDMVALNTGEWWACTTNPRPTFQGERQTMLEAAIMSEDCWRSADFWSYKILHHGAGLFSVFQRLRSKSLNKIDPIPSTRSRVKPSRSHNVSPHLHASQNRPRSQPTTLPAEHLRPRTFNSTQLSSARLKETKQPTAPRYTVHKRQCASTTRSATGAATPSWSSASTALARRFRSASVGVTSPRSGRPSI